MFKKTIQWYKRLLVSQHRLANDAQYWRPSYYWKALLWSGVGCIAVSVVMVAAIMTIGTNSGGSILLANIYNGCIYVVGVAIVLPLAIRYNSIAECMWNRWRSKKRSSAT